jgi:ubiquinone/menaquinone biosynthesis C-methylase UbiE
LLLRLSKSAVHPSIFKFISMKYYDPSELKALKEHLKPEFEAEGTGSMIVEKGRARDITLRYVEKDHAVLDVGCGSAKFLCQLAADGFTNLHGLDFDAYYPSSLHLRSFKSADLSWDRMPWNDASFDIITGWEVIEHLENPPHFLREMHRLLKPEGLLILSTPNVDQLYNRLVFLKSGDMPRWRELNNHLFCFPKGVFRKLLGKYFTVKETVYVRGEFPYKIFRHFTFPETKLFGNTVCWVLQKRKSTALSGNQTQLDR